jgi:hypothetical protein
MFHTKDKKSKSALVTLCDLLWTIEMAEAVSLSPPPMPPSSRYLAYQTISLVVILFYVMNGWVYLVIYSAIAYLFTKVQMKAFRRHGVVILIEIFSLCLVSAIIFIRRCL